MRHYPSMSSLTSENPSCSWVFAATPGRSSAILELPTIDAIHRTALGGVPLCRAGPGMQTTARMSLARQIGRMLGIALGVADSAALALFIARR